jgi:hypothetical protein
MVTLFFTRAFTRGAYSMAKALLKGIEGVPGKDGIR